MHPGQIGELGLNGFHRQQDDNYKQEFFHSIAKVLNLKGISARPEKNSVKKMTIFIVRNKNIINPKKEVLSLGSNYQSQMI
jgi:hypothetical protein